MGSGINQQEARELAETIAGLLSTRHSSAGLSSIDARLIAMEERLDRLEARRLSEVAATRPALHPSLDKLNIAEAIADSIFAAETKEKACTFEPSKACDHCSMCNSRGF